MNDKSKSHEALVCGHCGVKNRMYVIVRAFDIVKHMGEDEPPYEDGTQYEVQLCPAYRKIVLVSGPWHDAMEDIENWVPKVLLPESEDRAARRLLQQQKLDRECMIIAVAEARKCASEGGSAKPKVGAVVARGGKILAFGYRGELAEGEHAEYTVLEGKCKNVMLAGATVYTTLEPCTIRNPPKTPCTNRLVSRKVARVVVGMLDPDERIRGRGVLALRKANIQVDLFPPDLMAELEGMDRDFIAKNENL